jgi:hypothetical protein
MVDHMSHAVQGYKHGSMETWWPGMQACCDSVVLRLHKCIDTNAFNKHISTLQGLALLTTWCSLQSSAAPSRLHG